MRYYNGILLGIVVFLAEITIAVSLLHTEQYAAIANTNTKSRSLRSYTTITGDTGPDNEDRVGTAIISSKVDDLINKLFRGTSSTEKAAIQALLNAKVHPKELFGTLRLGAGAAKLDDNPNLLQWLRLAAAYRKKNGEEEEII